MCSQDSGTFGLAGSKWYDKSLFCSLVRGFFFLTFSFVVVLATIGLLIGLDAELCGSATTLGAQESMVGRGVQLLESAAMRGAWFS